MASGSGWNLWVWLLGVVVRRYIDFLILLIPTPLVSVLFYTYFWFIFLMFFVLYIYSVIKHHSISKSDTWWWNRLISGADMKRVESYVSL